MKIIIKVAFFVWFSCWTVVSYSQFVPPDALYRLRVTFNGSGSSDECVVALHPFATDNYDVNLYDSPKLLSNTPGVPNVFTFVPYNGNQQKLAVNCLASPLIGCHTISAGIRVPETGSFTFEVLQSDSFPQLHLNIRLVDRQDTFRFDSVGQTYDFNAVLGDSIQGRFYLLICPDITVGQNDLKNSSYNSVSCSQNYWNSIFETPQKNTTIQITDLIGKFVFGGDHIDFLS
jgi:hypothetical protein